MRFNGNGAGKNNNNGNGTAANSPEECKNLPTTVAVAAINHRRKSMEMNLLHTDKCMTGNLGEGAIIRMFYMGSPLFSCYF